MLRCGRFGALLCLLLLVGLTFYGCGFSKKETEDSKDEAVADGGVNGDADIAESADKLAKLEAELDKLRSDDAVDAGAKDKDTLTEEERFEQARQRARIILQKSKALSKSYLKRSYKYKEIGDFQKALYYAERAVESDSENIEAFAAKKELSWMLEKRPSGLDGPLVQYTEAQRVKRQHAITLIRKHTEQGKELYTLKKYDEALKRYREALRMIKSRSFSLDLQAMSNHLEQLVSLAEGKREEEKIISEKARLLAIKYLEDQKAERRHSGLQTRVNRLWRQAVAAYANQDFEQAKRHAQLILQLVPDSYNAKDMVAKAQESYDTIRLKVGQLNRFREWRETFLTIEEIMIPRANIINYPKNWNGLPSRARSQIDEATGDGADASRVKIIAALEETHIPLWKSSEDESLSETLTALGDIASVSIITNFQPDDDVDVQAPTLKMHNTNAYTVLRMILRMRKLGMEVEDAAGQTIIYVAPGYRSVGEKVLKTYDVSELVMQIRDFPGQAIMSSNDEEPFAIRKPNQISQGIDGNRLIDMIREYVGAGTWDDDGNMLKYHDGQLFVKNTRKVQAGVSQMLGGMKRSSGILIYVETRYLSVTDDFITDIGVNITGMGTGETDPLAIDPLAMVPFNFGLPGDIGNRIGQFIGSNTDPGFVYNDGSGGMLRSRMENLLDTTITVGGRAAVRGGLGLQFNFLDDVQMSAILNMVKKTERGSDVATARLTLFNAQRANIVVTRNNAIIPDYDVAVASGIAVADPVPGVVRDGIFLDVRATASPDLQYVTLDLRPTMARLLSIETRRLQLAEDVLVDIQLPTIEVQSIRTTAKVPNGGIVMLGGQSGGADYNATVGVPFFSNIPILKFFLQRKVQQKFRTNMIILVKTKILDLREEEYRQMGENR